MRTWRPERDRRVVARPGHRRGPPPAGSADEPRLDAAMDAALLLAALASPGRRPGRPASPPTAGCAPACRAPPAAAVLPALVDAMAPLEPALVETDWLAMAGAIRAPDPPALPSSCCSPRWSRRPWRRGCCPVLAAAHRAHRWWSRRSPTRGGGHGASARATPTRSTPPRPPSGPPPSGARLGRARCGRLGVDVVDAAAGAAAAGAGRPLPRAEGGRPALTAARRRLPRCTDQLGERIGQVHPHVAVAQRADPGVRLVVPPLPVVGRDLAGQPGQPLDRVGRAVPGRRAGVVEHRGRDLQHSFAPRTARRCAPAAASRSATAPRPPTACRGPRRRRRACGRRARGPTLGWRQDGQQLGASTRSPPIAVDQRLQRVVAGQHDVAALGVGRGQLGVQPGSCAWSSEPSQPPFSFTVSSTSSVTCAVVVAVVAAWPAALNPCPAGRAAALVVRGDELRPADQAPLGIRRDVPGLGA